MIAIVTSDDATAEVIVAEAEARGHECRRYGNAASALDGNPALMFFHWDRGEPLATVLAALALARRAVREVPVVVVAPPGSAKFLHRVRADGASDTLLYPPDPSDVGSEIDDYCGAAGPADRVEIELFRKATQDLLIGQNAAFRRRLEEARVAARCDANVLLLGETGTGKEMFARAIHKLGRRVAEPFKAVNCNALTESLIESELFGVSKGAFTGATERMGYFQAAGAGTLLLDEIGTMKLETQIKLLRVIDQREFQRVGGTATIKFNGRLICATSVDLDEAEANGTFGTDLLGRIRQFRIVLPPLRERKDDIRLLASHFLRKHARTRQVEIGPAATDILEGYDFPMNIRELENIIVEALARSDPRRTILPKHLPEYVIMPREGEKSKFLKIRVPRNAGYKEIRSAAEREVDRLYLEPAFEKNANNQNRTAEELGIDRKTLASRLEQLNKAGLPHDA